MYFLRLNPWLSLNLLGWMCNYFFGSENVLLRHNFEKTSKASLSHTVFALQITCLWHESLKLLGLCEGPGGCWEFFPLHKGDGSHFYLKWVWVKYSRKLNWLRRLWDLELFRLNLQGLDGMMAQWEEWLLCKLEDLSSSPDTRVKCRA